MASEEEFRLFNERVNLLLDQCKQVFADDSKVRFLLATGIFAPSQDYLGQSSIRSIGLTRYLIDAWFSEKEPQAERFAKEVFELVNTTGIEHSVFEDIMKKYDFHLNSWHFYLQLIQFLDFLRKMKSKNWELISLPNFLQWWFQFKMNDISYKSRGDERTSFFRVAVAFKAEEIQNLVEALLQEE